MDMLQNPFLVAGFAGVITYILMYADCKISRNDKTTATYCKNILLVASLVGATVFLTTGGLSKISKIDIDTGDPGF